MLTLFHTVAFGMTEPEESLSGWSDCWLIIATKRKLYWKVKKTLATKLRVLMIRVPVFKETQHKKRERDIFFDLKGSISGKFS